jgi:dTMP kinase
MKGHLIVFEGPDAVGKSTLVEFLHTLLEGREVSAEILAFPGHRPHTLGKLVYDLHHSLEKFGLERITPLGLQALHIAAHLDTILQSIIPAISSGKWVVLDRFWWSTWVYGTAAGIEPRILESLIHTEKLTWGSLSPSVVFLVERSAPLREGQAHDRFIMLSELYRDLSSSQQSCHEIIHLVNEDPESAKQLVANWVNAKGDA